MTEGIVGTLLDGRRKFWLALYGNALLGILNGWPKTISGAEFVTAFIGFNTLILAGYAAEYYKTWKTGKIA